MLAYSYMPTTDSPDLVRYFNEVRVCSEMSLKQVLTTQNDGQFIIYIAYWIIGKLGDVHLLPAISTSIVYGIALYIVCDSAEKYNIEKIIPYVLLCQLMILPFNSIVSNIRNICAFSMIILASYLNLIKEKTISAYGFYIFSRVLSTIPAFYCYLLDCWQSH